MGSFVFTSQGKRGRGGVIRRGSKGLLRKKSMTYVRKELKAEERVTVISKMKISGRKRISKEKSRRGLRKENARCPQIEGGTLRR